MNCPKCQGTGYRYADCPECHDNGGVWCPSCAGAGQVLETCLCAGSMVSPVDQTGLGEPPSNRRPGMIS